MLLPLLNPFNVLNRLLVLFPLVVVQLFYIHWRYEFTLDAFQWQAAECWQYAFFITESMVVAYCLLQCIVLIKRTDRTAECNHLITQHKSQAPSADLFIPTYSESKNILSATIAAAKKDLHPNLTVWICDDSDRAWLRQLCEAEKVNYLNRPTDEPLRTKAANLHWSIPHGQADHILCLDADFQCTPNFTTRMTAFLAEPATGLVQAPQHFRNLDPIQRNLLGGGAWTEEQRFFFDVALPARDAWDNALCVGSCWATRREIINELGGFPTDSIVEDVYFGYSLKSIGYNTVYLNEKLATGLAAEDTPSYITQRTRWCLGAITLLTSPQGPLRARGLSLTDRAFYLEIPFYWLTHLHLLMLLLAPIAYGFLGYIVFNCSTQDMLSMLWPKNIFFCMVFYWISQGRCMPVITPIQKTLTLFQTIPTIFLGLIKPSAAKFQVTPKDIQYRQRTVHWKIAAPFIVIGTMTMISIALVLSKNYSQFDWSDYSAYNALLSAYSLVAVFLCCLICVDKPSTQFETEPETPQQGSFLETSKALTQRIFG